jgi:hypothetical protein
VNLLLVTHEDIDHNGVERFLGQMDRIERLSTSSFRLEDLPVGKKHLS